MQSDDLTKNQHSVIKPIVDLQTPADRDDDILEGGEEAEKLDKIHEEIFGDQDDKKTITEEVNKDGMDRIKDIS